MAMRHAMLIGCGDYDHLDSLRCPVADVRSMSLLLKDSKIGDFDPVTSFDRGEANFTILTALEDMLTEQAKPEDAALIYYSGHGKLDKHGQLYLATKTTSEKTLDATSLAIERIISYARRSRCKSVLMILDCCYSGAVRESLFKGTLDDAIQAASHDTGLSIMTSSTQIQPSHEKEGEINSIYTKFLVEGILTGQADVDNDGWIKASEAHAYTLNCVRSTGLQSPREFNIDRGGDFVVARNPRYAPLDPGKLAGDDYEKFFAVKTMAEMIGAHAATDEGPSFFIMIVPGHGYEIEGENVYSASGLTVSAGHTPNIKLEQDGFVCDTFFRPEMITKSGRAGKEVINNVIKVRLRLRFNDIWMIVGRLPNGRQINLYPISSGKGVLLTGTSGGGAGADEPEEGESDDGR